MFTIYKDVEVEVDVKFNDLDFDELIDELENEKYIVLGVGQGKQLLDDWAELYKSNRHHELLEQIRTLIQDHTGKVLP